MATLDYFSCRLSHSLPLPPEVILLVPCPLSLMSYQILEIHLPAISYIAKRYKTETTYVDHRNFFSRPLFKELYGALLDCRVNTPFFRRWASTHSLLESKPSHFP
jgi:hypothetical protein